MLQSKLMTIPKGMKSMLITLQTIGVSLKGGGKQSKPPNHQVTHTMIWLTLWMMKISYSFARTKMILTGATVKSLMMRMKILRAMIIIVFPLQGEVVLGVKQILVDLQSPTQITCPLKRLLRPLISGDLIGRGSVTSIPILLRLLLGVILKMRTLN